MSGFSIFLKHMHLHTQSTQTLTEGEVSHQGEGLPSLNLAW